MSASTLSGFAKLSHKAAARMVLDTLTAGGDSDLGAYWGLAMVLRAKLSRSERQGLAWAALMACDDDEAIGIAEAVIPPQERAGWPVVPFEDVVEEAAFSADFASPAELRAYAGVCLNRLPRPKGKAA